LKVLLDECVDRRFARFLHGYEVTTVPQMGWSGTKNGKLLTIAQQEFDVLITIDKNLAYQQVISKYNIAVLVLDATSNRLVDLQPLVSNVLAMLPNLAAGKIHMCSLNANSA